MRWLLFVCLGLSACAPVPTTPTPQPGPVLDLPAWRHAPDWQERCGITGRCEGEIMVRVVPIEPLPARVIRVVWPV